MQAKSNPLFVIINPPGIQYGMPGDSVEIHVVVINEGQQSAVINLFFTFDETFQKISNWANSPRASLAIAPKESSDEVKFVLEIPVDALPGTYDYTFVVDSPEHYPQDTPINFPGQIKVLLKEQTVIRANDPTFSIQPATNPNKPLVYQRDQPLQVRVKVENRSTRVDRFHLTCPELDDEWFRISYPVTGAEAAGLLEVIALELNPLSQDEILLEFRPPANSLAGNYSPTIRLHSENTPDLVLLDLVYIQIITDYKLDIVLNTILDKVSRNVGKYQLILMNQGNLVRELSLSAKSRDEEEICIYKFEPKEVKLSPGRSLEANLTIKPRPWWRQPWVGQPLIINFQIDVRDKRNLPITSILPQGVLVWKARPLWQFLLLMLLSFGLVLGAGYLIWIILNPEPLRIEEFSTNARILTEGDKVSLNWRIINYKQLKTLELTTKQPPRNNPLFSINNLDNSKIDELIHNAKICQSSNNIPQEIWICKGFQTGISSTGKYTFELKASYEQRKSLFSQITRAVTQTANVIIQEKPRAEILDFKTDKSTYKQGENIILNLSIKYPELLDKMELLTIKSISREDNQPLVENIRVFKFKDSVIDDAQLRKKCQINKEDNQLLKCAIPIATKSSGIFSYQLKAYSLNTKGRSEKLTENKIEILPKPFKIQFFKINGSDQPNQVLNEGDEVILTWKVEGENVQVKLLPYGNVNQIGSQKLSVTKEFRNITLQVTDISGNQPSQEKGFVITVNEKQMTPNPFISPLNRISPIPLSKQKPF
ncbi:hypothetical protein H6G27_36390 [Nostoc linckia FACHB-104]|nr:hypothetical protein [Nostoc linckia FACHB-104]